MSSIVFKVRDELWGLLSSDILKREFYYLQYKVLVQIQVPVWDRVGNQVRDHIVGEIEEPVDHGY